MLKRHGNTFFRFRLLYILKNSVQTMSVDNERGNELDAVVNVVPKRKSPFVKADEDGLSPDSDDSATSDSVKHARKYSFDLDLPVLRPNECEIVVDIAVLLREVDCANADDSGLVRVERVSNPTNSGRMCFQLVMFVTKRGAFYELGLYIRAHPPVACLEDPGANWVFRSVSILTMLINARNPASSRSVVNSDLCALSSHDPCRGWMSVVSFSTLEELAGKGFLFGASMVMVRGQASFSGCETITTSAKEQFVGYAGLENLGATCYLNGLLQSLFHLGKFREIVYKGNLEDSSDILSALRSVFYDLERSEGAAVSSNLLTRAFGWDSLDVSVQHDAQELNRLLIDRIETRLKPPRDAELRELFVGQIENYIECLDVEMTSKRVEPFYDLQLSILGIDGSVNESVEDAIQQYLCPEILEGPNAYDAGVEFGGRQRARKGVRFLSLPPVLTLQLMRFQFDFELCEMTKINSEFRFSKSLKIHETQYVLHSVLVHSGTENSGHYYAYIWAKGKWFKFDDSQVSEVSEWCALENNFGGPGQPDTVNYLHKKEEESGGCADKPYSAYMLTYVREDQEGVLLTNPKLSEVNPAAIPRLTDTCISPHIPVRFVDMNDPSFLSTVCTRLTDFVPSHSILASPSDTIGELVESVFGNFSNLFQISSDGSSIRILPISSDLRVGDDLCLYVVVDRVGPVLGSKKFPFFLVQFDPTQTRVLSFSGLVSCETPQADCLSASLRNDASLYALESGFDLVPVQGGLLPGTIIVIQPLTCESAVDYFHRAEHTLVVDLVVWDFTGDTVSERKISLDVRDTVASLYPKQVNDDFTSSFIAFSSNPFLSDSGPVDSSATLIHAINRDTMAVHLVQVPADWGPGCVLVRFFSQAVVETTSCVLRGSPDELIGEFLGRVKRQLKLSHPLRIVDTDDSQIANLYRESDLNLTLSGLLAWGARNMFANPIRVEEDVNVNLLLEEVWVNHFDRSDKRAFGHPFVLSIEPDASDQSVRELISEKLGVSAGIARGWRLVEEECDTGLGRKRLVVVHPQKTDKGLQMKE